MLAGLMLAGYVWGAVIPTAYPTCASVLKHITERHAAEGRKLVRQTALPDDSVVYMYGADGDVIEMHAVVFMKVPPNNKINFVSDTFRMGGSCHTPDGEPASFYTARIKL